MKTTHRMPRLLCLALALCAVLVCVQPVTLAAGQPGNAASEQSPDDAPTITEHVSDGTYTCSIPEDQSLSDVIAYMMQEYGLNENNFAISYYNTVTGERYAFNETHFMVAASTYKLPLNLYYYEQQAAGVYSGTTNVGGYTLDHAHFASLVYSNNEVSHAMIYHLGNFRTYKTILRDHYSGMAEEEFDPKYYSQNYFCTKFMCNTLQYLYERMDQFPEMLDYLKQAMQEKYLARYNDEIEVAHKYGTYEGAENDVGIVFAAQPYLLAVYTYRVGSPYGEEIVARIGEAVLTWTQQQAALQAAAEAEARALEKAKEDALAELEMREQAAQEAAAHAEAKAAARAVRQDRLQHGFVIAAAAALLLLCVLYALRRRSKHRAESQPQAAEQPQTAEQPQVGEQPQEPDLTPSD